jgi:hypothetical protein
MRFTFSTHADGPVLGSSPSRVLVRRPGEGLTVLNGWR